ncbi:MAG: hypothetical protein ACFKPT_26845 [Gloeotrichia echinulata GP01]
MLQSLPKTKNRCRRRATPTLLSLQKSELTCQRSLSSLGIVDIASTIEKVRYISLTHPTRAAISYNVLRLRPSKFPKPITYGGRNAIAPQSPIIKAMSTTGYAYALP